MAICDSPSMELNRRWWRRERSDGNNFIIKTFDHYRPVLGSPRLFSTVTGEKKSSNKHHMKHRQVESQTYTHTHASALQSH